jgi:hypothetical protein
LATSSLTYFSTNLTGVTHDSRFAVNGAKVANDLLAPAFLLLSTGSVCGENRGLLAYLASCSASFAARRLLAALSFRFASCGLDSLTAASSGFLFRRGGEAPGS